MKTSTFMKHIGYIIFTSLLIACTVKGELLETTEEKEPNSPEHIIEPVDSSVIDTTALGLNFTISETYDQAKTRIRKERRTQHTKADFERYLLDEIIPHWYGTPWDFNGYTAVPNQGEIACGYFVSTTLLHAGININRYHLAQQAGLNEAKSLALSNEKYFTTYGIENLDSIMVNHYEDGLYFVGLDSHVGYLYMKDQILYFLHSNYIDDAVVIEKAHYSAAFQSNIYVVAELSTNELLLDKWRNNEVVTVIRQ